MDTRQDEGVSAIVGMILALGITVSMAAIALPAFLEAADTTRELARKQAELNRETIMCMEEPTYCPTNDTIVVCETETELNGTQRTECWTKPDNRKRTQSSYER